MQTRMKWTMVLVVAVVTAACGDSKSSLLPTAPSALSVDAASVDAGSAAGQYGVTGNGNGNGNNNGGGNNGGGNNGGGNGNGNGNGNGDGNSRTPTNTSPAPTAPVPPGKAKVEFEGLLQFADDTLIKVNGQTVYFTTDTVIRHGSRSVPKSDLSQGDRVHVRANRVETKLEAALILVQKPGDSAADTLPVLTVQPDVLVSVTALDDKAVEVGGDSATFRLSRTGTATQLAAPLSVAFTLTGAASGADYMAVASTASFVANEATVDVTVTPVNDGVPESPESVVLTVSPGPGVEPGSPAMATVMISDAPPPQVSVMVVDSSASEFENGGRFEVTRTGDLSQALTVTMEFSGTAELDVDYMATPAATSPRTLTYTFPPGQASLLVFVMPFGDSVTDPDETIVLSVVDGADYDLAQTPTGTIVIFGR